jgi:hypothetical protein
MSLYSSDAMASLMDQTSTSQNAFHLLNYSS